MRIALLSSQWPGIRLGGIGAYTRHGAAALARFGHEPHVFTLPLPAQVRREIPPGVTVHEIGDSAQENLLPRALPMGTRLKYNLALPFARHVLAVHARTPFDIVEAPEYEAPAFSLIGASQFPVVTQLHSGSAIARDVDGLPVDREQVLLEALELQVIAGGDGLCAPSQAVIRDTQAAYRQPELASHAQVIPLPFAVPIAPFALPGEDAPVLFVGRLELLKGAHLLAQAAAAFLSAHLRATLRIVGPDTLTAPDDRGRPSGKSMAAWMRARLASVSQRVTFFGEKTAGEIQDEMRAAAFVVIPSLRESYSYVCCEALAAGRPVVVSSDIGATEVAGPAGIQFRRGDSASLADAMDHLWTATDERASLSQAAWHRATTLLAPEYAVTQRIAFYEQIIAARRQGGAGEIEGRLLSLPPAHSFRVLVAQALAAGDADLLTAFLEQAELPPAAPTVGDRLLAQLNAARDGNGGGVLFHLYGAGRHTARILMEKSRWEELGHRLIGFIDDHSRFQQEPHLYGLPVRSCAAAAESLAAGDVVVLSTDAFEEQFWNNTSGLREKGIRVLRLYT